MSVEYDRILILDFGSQYSHLIVRRCREFGAYSELLPCTTSLDVVRAFGAKGVILSGGPASVYEDGAPHVHAEFWSLAAERKIPVLGICYGMQEMQHSLGGNVERSAKREFGSASLRLRLTSGVGRNTLFNGVSSPTTVWMSHGDRVTSLAPGFRTIAESDNSEYAAIVDEKRHLWGLQFHPEVTHSVEGGRVLQNFITEICGVTTHLWNMRAFAAVEIPRLRAQTAGRPVIGAISGGVDSTVAAALLHRAIGERFFGFFVDTGLLRKGEALEVGQQMQRVIPGLQLKVVDASARFLSALKGLTDPEEKRKTIGRLFVEVFVEAAEELRQQDGQQRNLDKAFLLQGTLYPDVIESVSFKGPSHTIKSHHNVGGLPDSMLPSLELLEPLRELFKGGEAAIEETSSSFVSTTDEVRALGIELGLDREAVWRHPFPGPGLAIRIIGEVTRERLECLREADAIFLEEIRSSGDYDKIGQAFVVLLPESRSVGVMGDQRTYGMTVVLRAVETSDFMTGDWYTFAPDVLRRCSSRIMNEVPCVNRVCYDISSKPPATIEWE